MLVRFDPFREMDRLTQLLTQQTGSAHQAAMPMDAYREGYRFIVHFDLPGVDPALIDLTVERNVLTVRAERTWQPAEDQEVVIAERPRRAFTRQLLMGENLDAEHVQASYDQGVLTLMIPGRAGQAPQGVAVAVRHRGGHRDRDRSRLRELARPASAAWGDATPRRRS